MNAPDYYFSTTDPDLNDAFTLTAEEPAGTLEEAVELATNYEADLTLTNDAGFSRGFVKADGNYSLT